MTSHSNSKSWERLEWRNPDEGYPDDPPGITWDMTSQWSDDLIIDGGNHGPASRAGFPRQYGDQGGDFWVKKRTYRGHSTLGEGSHFSPAYGNPTAVGRPHEISQQWIFPTFGNWNWPGHDGSSTSELNALGTSAIARTAPTKPEADLSSFLGELREGFPRAVGVSQSGRSRTLKARNAGDEYLNIEFGWKPLIRDLRGFAHSVKNRERILEEYRRNSGKLIKRKYEWPTELSVNEWTEQLWLGPLMAGNMYDSLPWVPVKVREEKRIERWFSAAYMYYVPPSNTPEGWLSDANKLLGTNLSPNTVWNMAPWTWAADWVGNGGDIAANLTYLNTDSLVIHHAYVMERVTVTRRYVYHGTVWRSYPEAQTIVQEFTLENKKRVRATPYGFGLNWNGLSTKQLGILAALGISRT